MQFYRRSNVKARILSKVIRGYRGIENDTILPTN